MTEGLKPYPAYKPSGVPWVGDVPEHWDDEPLKRWVRMNAAVLPETTAPDHEFRYLEIGSVGTGTLTQEPQRLRFGVAPSRARRVVRKGDTIVSTVRTYLKAVCFVGESPDELVCSTGFVVLTPRNGTMPKFVSYLARSSPFTDRVTADSVGVAYPGISETRLGSFHVAVPPHQDQSAIVRFLDYFDRRIRKYIRAKQKLIGLLNEQKQAIIHKAVTRGLDPNVKLKPSGVPWLGDVPKHWDVRRLKNVVRLVDRRSSTGSETLLSLRRDHGIVVYAEHFSRPPQGATMIGFKLVEVGQIVVNRLQANNGLIFCSGLRGLVSPDYSVLEVVAPVDGQYLGHLLRTALYRAHFRREATGLGTGSSGFLRLYDDRLLQTVVALPPIEEQSRILAASDADTASISQAIGRAECGMEALREYRTRLVADVVTGKLDVREAAANLPEEAEEVEEPEIVAPEELEEANEEAHRQDAEGEG